MAHVSNATWRKSETAPAMRTVGSYMNFQYTERRSIFEVCT